MTTAAVSGSVLHLIFSLMGILVLKANCMLWFTNLEALSILISSPPRGRIIDLSAIHSMCQTANARWLNKKGLPCMCLDA